MSTSALRRLAASVGFSLALELVLSGRPIKAEEALHKNLVHQVVACGSSKKLYEFIFSNVYYF